MSPKLQPDLFESTEPRLADCDTRFHWCDSLTVMKLLPIQTVIRVGRAIKNYLHRWNRKGLSKLPIKQSWQDTHSHGLAWIAGFMCCSSERTPLDRANEAATDASFVSDKKWIIKAAEIHFQFTVHLVPDFHAAIMWIYTDMYERAVCMFVYPVMCTWEHACLGLNMYIFKDWTSVFS